MYRNTSWNLRRIYYSKSSPQIKEAEWVENFNQPVYTILMAFERNNLFYNSHKMFIVFRVFYHQLLFYYSKLSSERNMQRHRLLQKRYQMRCVGCDASGDVALYYISISTTSHMVR